MFLVKAPLGGQRRFVALQAHWELVLSFVQPDFLLLKFSPFGIQGQAPLGVRVL